MGALATAFLVSRHGFSAGAAAGWARMLCPWLFAGAGAAPPR